MNASKVPLSEYYPLISILIGYLLVALTVGPYQNGDTAWEFDSVSGVLTKGLPYANGSYLIDQPPLGFYIQALFSNVVGLSIDNGTLLVTFFGLGCVALVYAIGKFAYNQTTGLLAAFLFAFTPWNIVISRSFLIDVPCLFFSLLTVFIALYAIQRGSLKLFAISGIAFAAAFNTKLYAVFALIPILALFLYHRPKKLTMALVWLAVFIVPAVVSAYLWYDQIAGVGLSSIFHHADFFIYNPNPAPPTYFFATNFLVSYGLGWLFIDAVAFSVFLLIIRRRQLRSFLFFDVVSVAVVACVIGVNTLLGATFDLNAPFKNAFKYDYQALPFFCFLAASMVSKSVSLIKLSKIKVALSKQVHLLAGLIGFTLYAATLFYNLHYTQMYSMWDYLIFRVEPGVDVGYSLFNSSPLPANSPLLIIQFIGFLTATSGVVWLGRRHLIRCVQRLLKMRTR